MLNGKCAVVTGGSRGIGAEIAKALASLGMDVVINYVSGAERAEEVRKEITGRGGSAICLKADVSDFDQAKSLIDAAAERFGGIYALVNNAGITRDALIMRMTERDFDDVLNTNLKGAWACTRHALPLMLKKRSGRIVNITSVVGLFGNAGQSNYAAAKAGMIGLTKSAAKESASRNVTVNAVAPGFVETEMTSALDEQIREKYLKNIPTGRFIQPAEIAAAVAYLLSDGASSVTGQVLTVDGGMSM